MYIKKYLLISSIFAIMNTNLYANNNQKIINEELKIEINNNNNNETHSVYLEEIYIEVVNEEENNKNDKKVNFQEILKSTFENNNLLNAEREKSKAVENLKSKTFRKNVLPNVGVDLNYGYTDFEDNMGNDSFTFDMKDNGEMYDNSIYLNQPLFKSGRTSKELESVENQVLMQNNKLMQLEQEVLYSAINATMVLLQNKEILNLSLKNQETLKNNYEYIKARKEVGRATIADLSLAEARYNESKSNTINANRNYLNSKSTFYKITGIDFNENIDVDYNDFFNMANNSYIDIETILTKALSDNPQFKIATYNYETNKSNLKLANREFLPELYLNAQYGKQKRTDVSSQEAASVALNLKVPLFQSGVEYSNKKEAGYLLNESKFTLMDVKEDLINQSHMLYEDFVSSKSLVLSSQSYKDASKLAYENVKAEEMVGKSDNVDVLNRRKEYYEAEISFLKSKINTIMHYYNLKMLTGELNLMNLFNVRR